MTSLSLQQVENNFHQMFQASRGFSYLLFFRNHLNYFTMGIFTKGKNSGLLDDRKKSVKTAKKVLKIATLGIVDTTGKKKNSSIFSNKK